METPALEKRFGLVQSIALNMSNMIGIGPFITIPLLMAAMGGPQALLGWLVAVLIVIPDGMVWSELAAALPGSGGTYRFLKEGFGPHRWGRLMAFLFIWQFIFSGPLEIASGYIGFAHYAGYIWPGMTGLEKFGLAAILGVSNILLLYRQIKTIGRITVTLWVGTLLTSLGVIIAGSINFDPKVAFDFPPGAFNFSLGFFLGLGTAARVGIYDYLGYYDICYIGEEVKNPGKVMPRAILISVLLVALIYILINLSIIGTIPWREFVPENAPGRDYIVSILMEKVFGTAVATIFTLMVLWTCFGSVFALLLGYSRIPYAAAKDGYFFSIFAKVHPTRHFPHYSLLLVGGIAIVCSYFTLQTLIDALITTRILIQFVGQIAAVVLLRKLRPEMERPYRIWFYPVPLFIAGIGWFYIFFTSGEKPILLGLISLFSGLVAFLLWSAWKKKWPFNAASAKS